MKFYLIFKQSGDCLPFETDKPDLLEYYLEFLQRHSANEFSLISDRGESNLGQLYQTLVTFNNTVPGELISFVHPSEKSELLDQDQLNRLHCEWVHSNHKQFSIKDLKQKKLDVWQPFFDQISNDIHTVSFSEICYKFNVQEIHSAINHQLHCVETMFNRMIFQARFDQDWGWIETPNVFPKHNTSNYIANLSLKFNHYGRTLYDKFRTWDSDLLHDDENTFNQLLGYVQLSLTRPETISYSPEYLQWCTKIGREPGGNNLNLGNILDLEKNLFEYRKLLHRNSIINNNCFQLSFDIG